MANNAPEEVRSRLLSYIRQDGLDVQIEKNGAITLVRGDKEALKRKVNELIANRSAARERKDSKESDRIRDKLAKMGVVLKTPKTAPPGRSRDERKARAKALSPLRERAPREARRVRA